VVTNLRNRIAAADVVLIAAPEYAGALAGTIKNALDWIVGSGELHLKPTADMTVGSTLPREERLALVRAVVDGMGIDPNHIAPLF
jgi:NAD(P)H-dependent FMN reductase